MIMCKFTRFFKETSAKMCTNSTGKGSDWILYGITIEWIEKNIKLQKNFNRFKYISTPLEWEWPILSLNKNNLKGIFPPAWQIYCNLTKYRRLPFNAIITTHLKNTQKIFKISHIYRFLLLLFCSTYK